MATGKQTDVSLVIKAKDEASRAISAIEGALKDLLGTQKNLATGSTATADGISKIITTLAGLDKAYSSVAGASDQAAQATARQLASLAGNQAGLAALTKQLEAARAAQARMNDFVGPPSQEMTARYQGVAAEVKNLEGQFRSLQKTVNSQESGFTKSASDLNDLARATKLAGAVTTFATDEAKKHTAALEAEAIAAAKVAAASAKAAGVSTNITRVTDSTTGKSASDSADVFQRAGLTDTEKQITATEKAAAAERDRAAAILLTENALRARARVEGNGGSAGRAEDTAFADQLKAEEAAAAAEAAELGILAEQADRLRTKMDPLAKIQANLNTELARLPAVAKAGKFSTEELAAAEALLRKNADDAAKALGQQTVHGGKPTLFGLKPYDLQNLSFQINDVVTQIASGTSVTQTLAQQGGQILQIFPKAGAAIVAALTNPAVLVAAATIGVFVAGLHEAIGEETRIRQFGGALAAMGDAGGATADALEGVVESLDRYSLSAEDALKITRTFLRDGLNPAYFEQFGKTAKDMADVLGTDVNQAAQQLGTAFTGGYDAIVKLDVATNAYTADELKLIKQLFEEGKAQEARAKAFQIFSDKMDTGATKMRGPWKQATDGLSNAWDGLLQSIANSSAIKGVLEDLEHRMDSITRFFNWLNGLSGPPAGGNNAIDQASERLATLRKELQDLSVEFAGLTAKGTPSDPFTQRYVLALRTRIEALLKQINDLKGGQPDTLANGPNSPETKRSNDTLDEMSRERELQKLREDGAQAVENLRIRGEAFLSNAEQRRRVALAGELAATKAVGDQRVKDAARANAEDDERLKIRREQDAFNAANSTPAMITRSLIQEREGFRSKPYRDNDGRLRIGFGSDTMTSAGGAISTVTANSRTDLTSAIRDLDRRIGEFQNGIKANIGSDRFNAFNAQQQAALTSIAYNYGTLARTPDGKHGAGIADTVRTGTTEQIAAAIRKLGNDNGGINRTRRNREADLFMTPNAAIEADNEKQQQAADQRQSQLNTSIEETNAQRKRETAELIAQGKLQDEALVKQQIIAAGDKAVADLEKDVATKNANLKPYEQKLVLTKEQIDATRHLAEEETRAATARNLAQAQTDATNRPVNDLSGLRDSLRTQSDTLRALGDTAGADALEEKIKGVDTQLVSAIDHAIAFFKALDPATDPLHRTREQIDATIAQLETARAKTFEWNRILGVSGETIANTFASTATGAIDQFAQDIANGENAITSLGNAFRKFAADFLLQIARMIEQQIIFNLISGLFGGGGGLASDAASTIAANPSIFHAGGIAGGSAPTRSVSPAWFTNAARYHSGGIAGLLPNEVPAILQRGEEVLTSSDPRHAANGGMGGGGPDSIKVVNLIDPGDMVSKGLATKQGEKSFFNFVSNNSAAFEAALRRR